MSDFFDINRIQLQKIFDAHQIDGSLTFTDILKICSSARIFPDLLTSQNLRKIAGHASKMPGSENNSKLNYPQFEKLLKTAAQQCFHSTKGHNDQYRQLLNHMKNSCHIRYKIDLDVSLIEKKTSKSVTERKIPGLQLDNFTKDKGTRTNSGIMFKHASTKNSTAGSFVFSDSPSTKRIIDRKIEKIYSIVSPRMKNITQLKLSENSSFLRTLPKPTTRPPLTDRLKNQRESIPISINSSACPSPTHLTQLRLTFEKFKRDSQQLFNAKFDKVSRSSIRNLIHISRLHREKFLKLKLCFEIWKLSK